MIKINRNFSNVKKKKKKGGRNIFQKESRKKTSVKESKERECVWKREQVEETNNDGLTREQSTGKRNGVIA